jgi:hypothetical protein
MKTTCATAGARFAREKTAVVAVSTMETAASPRSVTSMIGIPATSVIRSRSAALAGTLAALVRKSRPRARFETLAGDFTRATLTARTRAPGCPGPRRR